MVEYDKESNKIGLIILLIFIAVFVLKSFDMELEYKKSIDNNKTEIAYTEEEFQKISEKSENEFTVEEYKKYTNAGREYYDYKEEASVIGIVVDVIEKGNSDNSIIIADAMDTPVNQQIRVFCSPKEFDIGDKVLVEGSFRFGSPRTAITKYEMYYERWRGTPNIKIIENDEEELDSVQSVSETIEKANVYTSTSVNTVSGTIIEYQGNYYLRDENELSEDHMVAVSFAPDQTFEVLDKVKVRGYFNPLEIGCCTDDFRIYANDYIDLSDAEIIERY
ncbi:hypothetical protein [Pseudobutyrivibrio sp.]|uniref:hypothetical protein n=1 Tax=Pseudobutyrivibrio sp. TaxID=2014367 RepID=UPI0025F12E85|nr:hypothetical protein [Pseudobutyrivibrio sp.]MBR5650234.1 hypothetical protein [Pseudobutyrivibrio sp.]